MYKDAIYTLVNDNKEKLNFYYDDALFSPREDTDCCLGVICTPQDRKFYNLNENQELDLFNSKEQDKKELNKYIHLPIYAYLHSNIVLAVCKENPFNCQFDSGLLGYIYTTMDKIKQFFPKWKKLRKNVNKRFIKFLVMK